MAGKKLFLVAVAFSSVLIFSTLVKAESSGPTGDDLETKLTVTKVKTLGKTEVEREVKTNSKSIDKSDNKEDFKSMLEEKRKEASESNKLKLDIFEKKLKTIKDEKKKELTNKINTRLSEFNQKITDKFTEVLDKLSNILDKLTERASEAKTAGKNTAAVDTAITNAKNKITAARTAVLNQAAINYIAQITGETTLFTTVGKSVSQFEQDIMILKKLIIEAKQAVMNVVTQLAKLGVGELSVGKPFLSPTKTASTTPTVTVTGTATSGATTK